MQSPFLSSLYQASTASCSVSTAGVVESFIALPRSYSGPDAFLYGAEKLREVTSERTPKKIAIKSSTGGGFFYGK